MADIFISYSRRDKEFVATLSEALAARGKEAWVDWKDIPASAEWLPEIQEGIDTTDAFLFVLSPDSVRSDVCARELHHAIERRKRILPIVHRDVDPDTVRPEAAAINWVYLRDEDSFEAGLETLVTALDTDLEYVKAHTRLANQAISWDRAGRDRARLLRGSELETAERWLIESAAKQPAATERQAQFVQASRDAARRRGRAIFAAITLALLVAVALAIVALIQRADAVHQSHVAFARELDANAVGQYDADPELSVLLAAKAAQVAPGAATREALRSALARSHIRQRYANPAGQPVGDALWSPDGSRLLVSYEGADQARIVIPGSQAQPLVLRAPGVYTQIAWDGKGKLAVTGGSQLNVWNGTTGSLVRRLPTVGLEVAISPEGERVASADLHRHIQVWSVSSGGRQAGVTLPSGVPSCLRFSPDGAVLAVCLVFGVSPDQGVSSSAQIGGGLVLLDAHTGRILHTLPVPGPLESVAFSPDSRRVAVASNATSSTVRGASVFDVHTGATVLSFPGAVSAVTFSPDGKQFAYATLRGNIGYVYTFADGTSQPLVGNAGTINSISFSPDGAYVVTGSADRTARVFEYLGGKQVEVLAGHTARVTDARMNADDTQLATASGDGTVRVWTTTIPRPRSRLLLGHGQVVSVGFSPRTGRLAVFGPGGSGELLDQSSLRRLAAFAAPPGDAFLGGAWSPDGRWLGALAGPLQGQQDAPTGKAYVYDGRTGALTADISPVSPVTLGGLDDKGHLATASANGEVQLWDSGGHLLHTLMPGGPAIQDLEVAPDGSKLAVTHRSGTIDIFSGSGARLMTIRGPAPQPQIVGTQFTLPVVAAFSPDGRWLASAGADKNVQLWDLTSGRKVGDLPGGPFVSLAFNQAGSQLAAGAAASAFVWQVPSGVLLREFQHADSSTFGTVIVNRFQSVHVAFSADGQTLATTGDIAVRAWSLATGDSLFDAPNSLGAINSDASQLVGVQGNELNLYRCELCGGLDQLLAAAQRNTTRPLSPGERALYLHQS